MKKFLFIAAALTGMASTALAEDVSTTIPVQATVTNSCVFEGEAQALTFNYTATNGIDAGSLQEGVSAILHCNFGTLVNDVADITINTDSKPMRGGTPLNVEYSVTPQEINPGLPGQTPYGGSDSRVYIVGATAPTGQWVASGDYTATININVNF